MIDLGDANWKTRLAALEEMMTWVESGLQEIDAEVVVRVLAKKGSGEKNFQVSSFSALHSHEVICSAGLSKSIRHLDRIGRAMSVIREVMCRALH